MAEQSLGELIDELYGWRTERLEQERAVAKCKEAEQRVREEILQRLADAKLESASGGEATASVTRKIVPALKDWDAFTSWVREKGAFDLLERRVSRTAFRECLDNGTFVPGVESVVAVDLSLTKSRKG